MEYLSTSYLAAIQDVPGETRTEKFEQIGRYVNRIQYNMEDKSKFTKFIVDMKVPKTLVPLIKVLLGVKIKSYEYVIEALKTDDIFLVTEALRAKWLFDGSNETITNFKYYSNEILPFVSMSTRREIVKRLAVGLDKKPAIAEDFFNGFVTTYNLNECITLLPACGAEFIFKAIVKHKIVLNNKLLKKIYYKYPDVALKYLQFTDPTDKKDEISRVMFWIVDITEYEHFLPLLVTNHPEVFVQYQEICHSSASLGNKRARMFLKKAKNILIKKPKDIIELMPFKLICDSLTQEEFETMFSNILDSRWDTFNVNDMLNYLEYYPEDKRATLLRNKVKEKYGYDLFEKIEKLTTKFLLLLPKEERYALTRKIINNRHKMEEHDPETTWWCYLPVEEAIPALKKEICKTSKSYKQQSLFSQLIYVCKLNESKEALLDVLEYVDDKCKNARSDIILNMLDRISQEFDLNTLDEKYWVILFNIIKRIKLKKETARDYWVLNKILKKNVHFCVNHNLPYYEIINLIVKLFLEGRVGVSWLLLEDEPEYERKYLDVCFRHRYWLNMEYKKNVIEGIYSFNERHAKGMNSKQRFSIKDYPSLLKVVEETLKKDQNKECSWVIYTKEKLKRHEPELYNSWFPNEKTIDSSSVNGDKNSEEETKVEPKEKIIYLTEAIIALKRSYGEIKKNWPRYYECCKNEVVKKKRRRVKKFLQSLRWYQDVPMKFAERAIEENNFDMMGYLFDGPTFSKVAQKCLPKPNDKDPDTSCINVIHIVEAITQTSPPISTDLVLNHLQTYHMYSFKNYINDGLKLWSYVAYRTASNRMIDLTKRLANDRYFMKRHAVRLMFAMSARNDIVNFFLELWKTEEHSKLRELIAVKTKHLFSKRPSQETWELMKTCINGLSVNEDDIFQMLITFKAVSSEFARPFSEEVFNRVKNFTEAGLSTYDAAKLIDQLFENIKSDCTDCLSETFYKEIIDFYLANNNFEFSNADKFIVKVYLHPSSAHFDSRVVNIGNLLKAESDKWYSIPLEKRKHTPNFVANFVQVVVAQVQKLKGSLKVVERLSEVFKTIFKPYEQIWSHIMLFLCMEYMKADPSFQDFGISIAEKISILIETYTRDYLMHIIDLINKFVSDFIFYEYSTTVEHRLEFLEGLTINKNPHGLLIAAKLIYEKLVGECDLQQCTVLQRFAENNDPIIQSFFS